MLMSSFQHIKWCIERRDGRVRECSFEDFSLCGGVGMGSFREKSAPALEKALLLCGFSVSRV